MSEQQFNFDEVFADAENSKKKKKGLFDALKKRNIDQHGKAQQQIKTKKPIFTILLGVLSCVLALALIVSLIARPKKEDFEQKSTGITEIKSVKTIFNGIETEKDSVIAVLSEVKQNQIDMNSTQQAKDLAVVNDSINQQLFTVQKNLDPLLSVLMSVDPTASSDQLKVEYERIVSTKSVDEKYLQNIYNWLSAKSPAKDVNAKGVMASSGLLSFVKIYEDKLTSSQKMLSLAIVPFATEKKVYNALYLVESINDKIMNCTYLGLSNAATDKTFFTNWSNLLKGVKSNEEHSHDPLATVETSTLPQTESSAQTTSQEQSFQQSNAGQLSTPQSSSTQSQSSH